MAEAFRQDERYLAYSDYAMQLRPYLETFGRGRVFTLTLEALQEEPELCMRSLFAWLGVDGSFTPPRLGEAQSSDKGDCGAARQVAAPIS